MKFKIVVLLFCMMSGLNAAIPPDTGMLPFYKDKINTFMSFVNRMIPDSRQPFLEMINYPESEPRTLEEYASFAYFSESYKIRDILKKSYGIPEKKFNDNDASPFVYVNEGGLYMFPKGTRFITPSRTPGGRKGLPNPFLNVTDSSKFPVYPKGETPFMTDIMFQNLMPLLASEYDSSLEFDCLRNVEYIHPGGFLRLDVIFKPEILPNGQYKFTRRCYDSESWTYSPRPNASPKWKKFIRNGNHVFSSTVWRFEVQGMEVFRKTDSPRELQKAYDLLTAHGIRLYPSNGIFFKCDAQGEFTEITVCSYRGWGGDSIHYPVKNGKIEKAVNGMHWQA